MPDTHVAETRQHQFQQSEVQPYNLKGTWEYMAETCLVNTGVQKLQVAGIRLTHTWLKHANIKFNKWLKYA